MLVADDQGDECPRRKSWIRFDVDATSTVYVLESCGHDPSRKRCGCGHRVRAAHECQEV